MISHDDHVRLLLILRDPRGNPGWLVARGGRCFDENMVFVGNPRFSIRSFFKNDQDHKTN